MFKKSIIHKQIDLFTSHGTMMSGREAKHFSDSKAWHNQFFRNVTSNIDEEVFAPLFSSGKDKGKDGRPNASVRVLVGMMILKEGVGCSDEQLYECCQYHALYRAALGLVNMDDDLPSLSSYYNLRRAICEYEEQHNVNLFDKCFKSITKAQAIEYKVTGKSVRMDSKLISSNIAWCSRYEIIHATFVKCVSKDDAMMLESQMERQQALELLGEDATKTVFHTGSEALSNRLLMLGIIIDHILALNPNGMDLLRRVFNEQFEKAADGAVSVRDKKSISADSVQNPNDPDAGYRSKGGKKTKGFVTNITETTDREAAPSLITDVQVEKATTADNTFVRQGIEGTKEVTGTDVEKVHADGAYQSEANRKLAASETDGFEFVANGIQGKKSRFDLMLEDDGTLAVTDKATGEKVEVLTTRSGNKWKTRVFNKKGEHVWRYFDHDTIERARVRREVEAISIEERNKRNNVEASIFQYCFHTRNNKTRYRGLFKHTMQALARCAWINMRRLFLFDLQLA